MELLQITKVFSKGTQFRDHTGFIVIVKRFHYYKLGLGERGPVEFVATVSGNLQRRVPNIYVHGNQSSHLHVVGGLMPGR
jgi:hypothetical protein